MKLPLILLFLFTGSVSFSQIKGTVTDEYGQPLEFVNIFSKKTGEGVSSDEKGKFELSPKSYPFQLTFSYIGFKEAEISFTAEPKNNLTIKLIEDVVKMGETVVLAGEFVAGESKVATVTSMDVVRTPGAQADVIKALQTFPGVTLNSDDAGLIVRGGSPEETVVYLDGTPMYHPFQYEDSYNQPSRTNLNPFNLKGISFSTGGYSVKYGNALSAIVDLKTQDAPERSTTWYNAGLAHASISQSFGDSKLGGGSIGLSGSNPELFVKVNNLSQDRYLQFPTSYNVNGFWVKKFTALSSIRTSWALSGDKGEFKLESPVYDGGFFTKNKTLYGNIFYSAVLSDQNFLEVSGSLNSRNHYHRYGSQIIDVAEKRLTTRIDDSHVFNQEISFNNGIEMEYSNFINGITVPENPFNNKPDVQIRSANSDKSFPRYGVYSEMVYTPNNRFKWINGIRSDYFDYSKSATLDLRTSLGYKLTEHSMVKASIGNFHQQPNLAFYGSSQGIENVKPAQSIQYILGFEQTVSETQMFRVEGYYKDYTNLPAGNSFSGITDKGYGISKGMDIFYKWKWNEEWSGWTSYSFVRAERKDLANQVYGISPQDITNSVVAIFQYSPDPTLTIGAMYRYSTGKPYNSVQSASLNNSNPTDTFYEPVYSQTADRRMSDYNKLDLSASKVFFFGENILVIYASVTNIFNYQNVYSIAYNLDYSKEIPVTSTSIRTIYFGITLGI